VRWRLQLFRLVYAVSYLLDWRRSHAGHRYRMSQARSEFTGGTTPLDRV